MWTNCLGLVTDCFLRDKKKKSPGIVRAGRHGLNMMNCVIA